MIYVFDAYGTLFDVNGVARRAANEPTLAHHQTLKYWVELT